MKIRSIRSLRPLALVGAALFLLAAAPGRAHAYFHLTLTQVGGDVVVTGSGSLDLAALTLDDSGGDSPFIEPNNAALFVGPGPINSNVSFYSGGGLTGPTAFGTGGGTAASSGSGGLAGISGAFASLIVPQGYVSGTPLTDSATFTGQTFDSLGFTPSTYTYTWGSGLNADSLVITSIVPEPSTWILFIAGGVSLFAAAFRRRRA